ncbi:MAG: PIG-L family deacetylase [Planctomycetales bacterium]|nr:PIG-L family deacetylase [Planctomycetales bacterium]
MPISKSVLAIAAHPDDIEFVMSGTMLQLASRGWELHYFNIADGCCGSTSMNRATCRAVRLKEAQASANLMQAVFYPPICHDLEIFYNEVALAQVCQIVRNAKPSVILTHALADYMEDHQNAARLAVTGAFARSAPNFPDQSRFAQWYANPIEHEVAIYHAQPHGNRDPMGEPVEPTHFVNVTPHIGRKRELLACHASQAQWLDASQRMGSYLSAMEQLNREVGLMSQQFEYCEGWRRHYPMGFSSPDFDPLKSELSADRSIVIRNA